jgi:hypothetical protein
MAKITLSANEKTKVADVDPNTPLSCPTGGSCQEAYGSVDSKSMKRRRNK